MQKPNTNDALSHLWVIWKYTGLYGSNKWPYYIYAAITNVAANMASPVFVLKNVFLLNDFSVIMHDLQLAFQITVVTLKCLAIVFKVSDLVKIRQYFNALDKRAHSKDEAKYLRNLVRQCRLMTPVLVGCFLISLVSFVTTGLMRGELMFDGWFPFDWKNSMVNYLAALAFQVFASTFLTMQCAANDTCTWILLNIVTGHIHVLCMRVARIGRDHLVKRGENFKELKLCISDHKNIIGLYEGVRPVISLIVFIQLLATGNILCITVVHFLLLSRELNQMVNGMIFLLVLVFQSFPVYYCGNSLMHETDTLTTAIYSCNWMDQSAEFKKCIIIFMQRSQKTKVVLAGSIAPVTLQTFKSILNFSVSMFAVLSQLK